MHTQPRTTSTAESSQFTADDPDDNNLPPPRLPSISSLLNSLPPPLPERNGGDVTIPTRERQLSNPSLNLERTDSPLSVLPPPPPPPTNLSLPPPPTEYHYQLHAENGVMRSPNEGENPYRTVSPRTYSPTISSQNQGQNFANRNFYQQLPVFDSTPSYDSDPHRQRSASFNTYPPYPPAPSHQYGRPYPGFATSSERRSSGSDERGMSHGGIGPWRNRRRGNESPYDGNGLPLPPSSLPPTQPPQGHWLQPSSYSPTRQRAMSISTTDEYYTNRPAWSNIPPSSMGAPPNMPHPLPLPPPPLHHLDQPQPHQQPQQHRIESEQYPVDYMHRPFPPSNSFNRGPPPPPPSAGVSNDFSYLRLGPSGGGPPPPIDYARSYPLPPQPPHQPYVPPALPIPPTLAPTPTEANPDLRPIVLPSGLAGSAPSSAGSASASHYSSSHSGNGLPTPGSTGPSSATIPSPNLLAPNPFDSNGNDGGGDGGGSTESGKYCCPHCSKRFARPSSLRIHTFSHTGEKPFTCPQCERAFSVQSNLRRHLKIHKNAGESNSTTSARGRSRAAPQSRSTATPSDFSRRNSDDMEEEDEDAEGERDE